MAQPFNLTNKSLIAIARSDSNIVLNWAARPWDVVGIVSTAIIVPVNGQLSDNAIGSRWIGKDESTKKRPANVVFSHAYLDFSS
ncbi:MAG: hypothetical protein KJ927_17270 [Candidatus Eisenbacteria bacterium]|nr:hypothetical protein [Candidatus Eisenbacteria bacterium]MBU1950469.1 hypothetical protein [Candidatus Eisenbacteria bacterium]